MKTLKAALEERMKEPGFRAEYEALEHEFTIAQAMIDAGKNADALPQNNKKQHIQIP